MKNKTRINKLIFLIIISIIISSCQTTTDISKQYKENPCQDLQYLKLRKMKVSEMTGSESEYYKMKNKECEQYSSEVKSEVTDSNFLLILGIAGVAAGLILSLVLIDFH